MTIQIDLPVNTDPVDNSPKKPDHIPDKFWNASEGKVDVDGMAKSYTELQQAFGSRNQQPKQTPAKQPNPLEVPETKKTEGSVGFAPENMERWAAEYESTGALSEATYQEIGLPRPVVDAWIDGQSARRDLARQAAFSLVGGEEQYTAMVGWAQTNLSKAEKDAYNAAVASSNRALRDSAIAGMYARFTQSEGSQPEQLIRGAPGGRSGVQPFQNFDQARRAMKDPRYKTDKHYQEEIAARIAISDF